MSRYSPEINAAIANVLRAPATKIATLIPTIDIQKVSFCLQKLLAFLRENFGSIGQQQFLITLDFEQTSGTPNQINAVSIVNYLNEGFNVIVLDGDFNILRLDTLDYIVGSAVSEYSVNNGCTAIHVLNGLDVVVYTKGVTVKELSASQPSAKPIVHRKYARNALDYKQSLIEFYQNRVRYAQYSDHWKPPGDKSQRILCSLLGGRKTEAIFHDNLRNWLDEHLDGAQVFGNVKKVSDDETDIEIRLPDGVYFILEIKWTGDNGSTQYSNARIRDGMIQVRNYLDRDPEVRRICLVVYDGRPLATWKKMECCDEEPEQWKEIKKCMTVELPPRAFGLLFFLENEDASRRK